MAAVTPKTSRKRRIWELTPDGPLKLKAKQVVRLPGAPLTQPEMRMALSVVERLAEFPERMRHKPLRTLADKAAFLCRTDAQGIRDLKAFVDARGELPMPEDTSLRGRKPSDMRSTRFVVVRNCIRRMNLNGENPTYGTVHEELKGWGWSKHQIEWACKRMGIKFRRWERHEALRERQYVVENRNKYVKREVQERHVYRSGARLRGWSDETYCNQNHVSRHCLCDDKMIVNQPSGML